MWLLKEETQRFRAASWLAREGIADQQSFTQMVKA
jgi:hypothetical protein